MKHSRIDRGGVYKLPCVTTNQTLTRIKITGEGGRTDLTLPKVSQCGCSRTSFSARDWLKRTAIDRRVSILCGLLGGRFTHSNPMQDLHHLTYCDAGEQYLVTNLVDLAQPTKFRITGRDGVFGPFGLFGRSSRERGGRGACPSERACPGTHTGFSLSQQYRPNRPNRRSTLCSTAVSVWSSISKCANRSTKLDQIRVGCHGGGAA